MARKDAYHARMTRAPASLALRGLTLALMAGICAHAAAQDDMNGSGNEAGPPASAVEAPMQTPPPLVPASPAPEPIAVLLLPSGGVEASVADALTELLIAAVAQRGAATILGKEEFQAQLGQGDASTAECLESITCLGRVGVALGVREVIAGTIGHHGTTWAFALNRIDLRTGITQGRVFREVEGDLGEVVRTLGESVDDLYIVAIEPGRLVVRASVDGAEVSLDGAVIGTIVLGEPVRRDLLTPGHHDVVVAAHGLASYRRTIDIEPGTTFVLEAELTAFAHHGFDIPALTWVLGGVALVALAGGIAMGVSSTGRAPEEATQREVQAYYAARANEAMAADVCFGVAFAATAGAVIPLILAAIAEPGADAGEDVQASVAPLPGGALVTVQGRLF